MAPKRAYQDPSAASNIGLRDQSSSPSAAGDISGSSQHSTKRTTGRSAKARRSYRDEVIHHPTHATDPSAPYHQPQAEEMSRRESTSTMRTSSIPLEGPVTYTPTTHRVSKAKKGKRVHACEFPGCGKVFTRAEHKRRHEGNHNPEAPFPCDRSGCRKAFHRPDLLQRHLERHDLEASDEVSGDRRQSSLMSMSSEMPQTMTTTNMQSPMTPVTVSRPHSGPISIGSLVNQNDLCGGYGGYENGLGVHTTSNYPYLHGFPPSEDSLYYNTPDSSLSPRSDEFVRHPHRHSISSASSVVDYHASVASPLSNSLLLNNWSSLPTPPTTYLPATIGDENGIYAPAKPDIQPLSSFSDLDGYAYDCIRRELSSAFGVISTGIFDNVRWQSCLNCYWQCFHPSFPILHQPTFFTTKPSPLLTGAMVAIGSQYDSRPDAKQYSMALLEICTRLLRGRSETIKSSSKLADMQIVLLLETLRRFRSRRTDTEVSSRFRTLYTGISEAGQWSTTNPLAVFRNLRPNYTADELVNAHRFWVDLETKRRIGHAAFCLDTTQAVLFEQPLTVVRHSPPRLRTTNLKRPIAFPCDNELWETSPVKNWAERASKAADTDLASATQEAVSGDCSNMDPFQSHLLLSHLVANSSSSSPNSAQNALSSMSKLPSTHPMYFTYSAFLAAEHTHIRDLLLVSGETWLLSRKIEDATTFEAAKSRLRMWVDQRTDSVTALWHATNLLRCVIDIDTPPVCGELSHFRDTYALHEGWCLYLSCLIVWAFGYRANLSLGPPLAISSAASMISEAHSASSTSSSRSQPHSHPTVMDAADADAEMRDYLRATRVPSAEHLKQLNGDVIGRTHGLLESVRLRKIANGQGGGGLLNEAERVLYRLVEGRSRLSHF